MIKDMIKSLLLYCGLQEYIDTIKKEKKDLQTRVDRLAATLTDALEARDAWRTSAIEYCRGQERFRTALNTACKGADALIRFELSRTTGLVDVVRDSEGQYVKRKAVQSLFTLEDAYDYRPLD